MSKPRQCISCGARYMTAHATNCPAYMENKNKRITELEAENAKLKAKLDTINSFFQSYAGWIPPEVRAAALE